MTTKRAQLECALEITKESSSEIEVVYQAIHGERHPWNSDDETLIYCRIEEMSSREFDDGYGDTEGEPMIAFGPNYVYISVQYDGAESVEAIPRHPQFVTNQIPWPGG